MATRFYPEEHLGRALSDRESVDLPLLFTHLEDDLEHSLIVAVDGACRKNGQPDAQAAIVKSHSTCLVSSMTEWIFTWVVNGFANKQGLPLQNQDLFQQLLYCVVCMTQKQKIQVQFWHVGREDNQDADKLANSAFLGATTQATTSPPWDFRRMPAAANCSSSGVSFRHISLQSSLKRPLKEKSP
ncbi:uncharacterized protein PG986_010233 [Apiospora aurea]|uniref:RNase H type-1 domain-containing protein n=1 Tax=Apiospora aurea TaxID=335848 RepID=A0ABR1QAL9_9PEZI